MKRIVKLTESDLTRIVKRMVNETKEKTDTKFNKKWVGMINTRLKNGNLNSALEMAENLNDEIGGMPNVVKHLKNAKSEIDKAKDKLNRLTESNTSRIVNNIISENRGPMSLDSEKDDLRHSSQRLLRHIDEYSTLMRKGEYKRMGDELDNIRRMSKRLKDVLQQIDSKI